MAKKVREQTVSLSLYLDDVKSGDISENQDVQRAFCWDNSAINELIVTVLTDDYIPPVILAEIELGDDIVQQYIVDGIQRTTALNKFRHMNYKTTKTFEDSIIRYQAKCRDENGKLLKEDDGSIKWETKEFDIRNKTFDQLPEELKKKFDKYQIRTVVHQNCSMKEISKLVRRYNRNTSMKANQKALTWIPTYARKIKTITHDGKFFKNCISPSDNLRKNGTYEQVVSNSVMATYHLDDWKKAPKAANEFLEANSNDEEFSYIDSLLNRIEVVCSDDFQDVFVIKDIPAWVAVFDKFTKLGYQDQKFADFLVEMKNNLLNKEVNGYSYNMLDKESGTKDKKIIVQKIDTYYELLCEYLGVESVTDEESSNGESVIDFVKENVDPKTIDEDIELYRDMVDECVPVDAEIYKQCEPALLAIMAYACTTDEDQNFEEWIKKYMNNQNFSSSQKVNFTYMKNDFERFINQRKTVSA